MSLMSDMRLRSCMSIVIEVGQFFGVGHETEDGHVLGVGQEAKLRLYIFLGFDMRLRSDMYLESSWTSK